MRKDPLHLSVLTRNDVLGKQIAYALGRGRAGIHSSLHRADFTAHHDRHQSAAHMHLADQGHVRRLDHGVRRLHGTDQALRFHHAQRDLFVVLIHI